MNKKLQKFARDTLKAGLEQLPSGWQMNFRLMYGMDRGKRRAKGARSMPIAEVVDNMPAKRLDWAMQQVENSLAKLKKMRETRG